MVKKITSRIRNLRNTRALAQTAQPGSVGNPCKLTPLSGPPNYRFQARAADMPISFLLDSPDKQTELLGVEVYAEPDTKNPLPNQPTAFSTIGFTLNLQPGNYAVTIALGALTTAQPVYITESCVGATKLDWIVSSANNGGGFGLQVIP